MTLRRLFFFLLIMIIPAFFQSSAFNMLTVGHIKPDLVLIAACYIGLHWDEDTGTCFGFFIGLLQDVFSAGLLGLNALAKTLFGYLSGKAGKRLNIRNPVVQIFLVALFSLLEGTIFLAALKIFYLPRDAHETFLHLVLPQTLYNIILTPILFWLISLIHQKWILPDE
ncbi:MAG: rod shape-determining protein MreD [bacterium]